MSDLGLDTAIFLELDQVIEWIPRPCVGIFVMPLSGDGVLLEQGRTPLLTFGFPLTCRLPLSFLQYELLIGGFGLVLVVDGSCHVLPQSF